LSVAFQQNFLEVSMGWEFFQRGRNIAGEAMFAQAGHCTVAGQRVPMEPTSLGRTWPATATDAQRQLLLAQFQGISVTAQAPMDAVANDFRVPLSSLADRVREEIEGTD
jgi:hypothetical protein